MNRQTILATVHRQLRESFAETGEVRPLGEIVSRVASEIRRDVDPARLPTPGLIPIEKVAAFVDGHLQPAEVERICQAVMVDNSVLAEIIAAVRATQESLETLPPLSRSLSAQLMAMQVTMPVKPDVSRRAAGEVPEIQVQPAPAADDTGRGPGGGLSMAALVLAIAASLVAAIAFWGGRDEPKSDAPMVVQQRPQAVTVPEGTPPPTESARDNPPSVAQSPRREHEDIAPPSEPTQPATTEPMVAAAPNEPSPATVDRPPEDVAASPTNLNPPAAPDPIRIAPATPQLADVRWTKVSGLLAQRRVPSSGTLDSASRAGPTWTRIQEGSQSSSPPAQQFSLRTLPFSRASGQLGTGGQVVLAEDTGLQITRGTSGSSAKVDLMHGAMAMVDVGEGTTVEFQHGDQTLVTLRWRSQASAVVVRDARSLQIQVEGGEIAVNDKPVRSETVRVSHGSETIDKVRAPKRLPRWVTRVDDPTAADRLILAQLDDGDDLAGTINQKIRSLASTPTLRRDDGRMLAKLAAWQAALAGPGVFRLAASRVPAVRLAAIQRLAQLSETDPRYLRTWTNVDRAVGNVQRTAQMRAWFRLLRSGARPSRIQLEQMLGGLSSRDFAGRAVSDFLLRQYVRNPPPFDPSWTGQTLQRAINVYRERAGIANRLRPNAAASGAVP